MKQENIKLRLALLAARGARVRTASSLLLEAAQYIEQLEDEQGRASFSVFKANNVGQPVGSALITKRTREECREFITKRLEKYGSDDILVICNSVEIGIPAPRPVEFRRLKKVIPE